MDMHRMEKKLASGRYTSIGSILEDMQLIRDNAYAYNTDKDSIEVHCKRIESHEQYLLDGFYMERFACGLYLSLLDSRSAYNSR